MNRLELLLEVRRQRRATFEAALLGLPRREHVQAALDLNETSTLGDSSGAARKSSPSTGSASGWVTRRRCSCWKSSSAPP